MAAGSSAGGWIAAAGRRQLAYNGVVNKANLGMMGNIAFEALRDLRFKSMIIRLDGDLAGEFATRLTIDGVGLGPTGTQKFIRSVLSKIPLKLNVSITRPVPRADRHRQGVPRPAPGDRATCCRGRSTTCPGSSPRYAARTRTRRSRRRPRSKKMRPIARHPTRNSTQREMSHA